MEERKRIELSKLSGRYEVRELKEADIEDLLALYKENTLFYQYCEARPTREQALEDMTAVPPGIERSSKYFAGFYCGHTLLAVMDLIDGYPEPDIAYLGLFMMDLRYQGKQIGSAILREAEDCLRAAGIKAVRLAINKGNPQSTHFWEKNGYTVIREVAGNKWGTLLEAEKML